MNPYSSWRINRFIPIFVLAGSLLFAQGDTPATMASKVKIDPHGLFVEMETRAAAIDLSTPQNAQQTVGNLFDHIFSKDPSSFAQIIPVTPNALASMRTQFINNEIAYWQNTNPGVTEQNVLDAFNNAVTTLSLPRKYLAAQSQVKHLRRVAVSYSNPVFMGTRYHIPDPTTGKRSINPVMSPLQAVVLFHFLVNAKLGVKEFQVTPEEWETFAKAHVVELTQSGPMNGSFVDPNFSASEFYTAVAQLSDTAQTQLWLSTLKYFGVN